MKEAIKFVPRYRETPNIAWGYDSAWGNIPTILKDVIERFEVKTTKAIEFGVEFGYSTSAISNYFEKVVGVDIFTGDIHAGFKGDIYEVTKGVLKDFTNIELVKQSYQDFTKENVNDYDFAHVDIVHTYEDTYACGEWCVQNCKVTIFHDTVSFPEVFKACQDLANKYDLDFYNYEESYGLGILVNRKDQ
jgi:hypothetical protein